MIAMVLAGPIGGSVAVFAPLVSAYLAFSVPIIIPSAIRFLIEGDPQHIILALMLLTGEHQLAQEVIHQAKHDALTGLVNWREFMHRLENARARGKRNGSEYVLCYMDLDPFKVVNDTAGHGAGDELLKQLTSTLLSRGRGRDTLGRFGGDEFGLLLDNCELDSGIQIVNSLLACLNEFLFQWGERVFQVGARLC
ncbi:MAG: diguanylate cyclase [Gammaproteobacteria bacterium]|jgi:diguanylate cyclase (GGDEF)-like protein|nr:diguanylate cyclase [Gammaproteobacteria bacterium]